MSSSAILYLISFYAAIGGVDPRVARSVASVESGLNPKAVGSAGEVGLFQIKPEYVKGISRRQLFNITTNIKVGVAKIKEAQRTCIHRKQLDYLTCYNMGNQAAKRVRYPALFPYVVKVKKAMSVSQLR